MHKHNSVKRDHFLNPPSDAKANSLQASNWKSTLRLLVPALLLEICWLYLWLAHPTSARPWTFQVLFALAFVAYAWAVIQALRLDKLNRRLQYVFVFGGALVFHLTLLPAPYAFSDDIFRYVWDGRVSAAGIDPYRYAPGDPALVPLRDETIWQPINAKEQPSPYPPLLEAWFALVYRLFPNSVLAMKASMIAINMGVIGLLLGLLHVRRQPPLRALIYAWSPQVVFQVGFSGHNEPLLLICLLGGLLLGQATDRKRPSAGRLTGAFALALATLAKLVPVLMFPVLLRRWGWRATGVYLATLGAVYGALLLRGQHVFDGVGVEARTAQFNDGIHYLVYRLAQLLTPGDASLLTNVFVAGGLATVLLALLCQRGDDMVRPVGTIMAAYVLLAASIAPWYTLWVLPFVALNALPQLPTVRNHSAWTQVVGSYWLIFSWTATFSELFYTVNQPLWRIVHVLEYMIPLATFIGMWAWSRVRVPQPGLQDGLQHPNYTASSDSSPVIS